MRFVNGLVRSQRVAWLLSLLLIPISMYMIFLYAPREASMGDVQRIFYIHVATAWNGFLFFAAVAVTSGIYLYARDDRWNSVAKSAGELGVLFTTLTLICGSLWARPVWNVWWTWDPRLTTTLILWFIYVAYLLIQAGADNSERQRRFGAIFGIVGFLDIPLVHFSAQMWRSIHPVVIRPDNPGMPPQMFATLMVTVAAMTALGLFLWAQRVQLSQLDDRVERLKETLLPLELGG